MKRKPGGGATRDIGRDVGIGLHLRKDCEKYALVTKMPSTKPEWKTDQNTQSMAVLEENRSKIIPSSATHTYITNIIAYPTSSRAGKMQLGPFFTPSSRLACENSRPPSSLQDWGRLVSQATSRRNLLTGQHGHEKWHEKMKPFSGTIWKGRK